MDFPVRDPSHRTGRICVPITKKKKKDTENSYMSQVIKIGKGSEYGKKRKYSRTMAATIIQRAAKRAKMSGVGSEAPMSIAHSMSLRLGTPRKLRVTLKYYEGITLADPAAGGVAIQVFRANDIYDPNFSGVGHQPLGTDQYFALYNAATVVGSRITVNCLNGTANGVYGVTLLPQSATGFTSPVPFLENPNTAMAVHSTNYQNVNQTVVGTFSARKFFDVKDPSDEDDLQCTATASPIRPAYYHVWAGALTSATDPAACVIACTIEYIVEFSQPIGLSTS